MSVLSVCITYFLPTPTAASTLSRRDFGPLLVAMDSTGASLYDTVRHDAAARRAAVLASLGVKP